MNPYSEHSTCGYIKIQTGNSSTLRLSNHNVHINIIKQFFVAFAFHVENALENNIMHIYYPANSVCFCTSNIHWTYLSIRFIYSYIIKHTCIYRYIFLWHSFIHIIFESILFQRPLDLWSTLPVCLCTLRYDTISLVDFNELLDRKKKNKNYTHNADTHNSKREIWLQRNEEKKKRILNMKWSWIPLRKSGLCTCSFSFIFLLFQCLLENIFHVHIKINACHLFLIYYFILKELAWGWSQQRTLRYFWWDFLNEIEFIVRKTCLSSLVFVLHCCKKMYLNKMPIAKPIQNFEKSWYLLFIVHHNLVM